MEVPQFLTAIFGGIPRFVLHGHRINPEKVRVMDQHILAKEYGHEPTRMLIFWIKGKTLGIRNKNGRINGQGHT
jgi:hypothetical protein